MKFIFLVFVLINNIFAQTYGNLQSNMGPDQGTAKNFGVSEWKGFASVGSELTVNGQTYSYIRNSEEDFKLSRKVGNRLVDVVPKLRTNIERGMHSYSRLLNVFEDKKVINIYSWGPIGYNFLFYQKRDGQEPRLIRFGYILNVVHSMEGFDDSIKALEFSGAAQLKITKDPATEVQKRSRPYLFKSPGVYEFRPDGVYLDGVFDPSVPDYEPQDVVDENLRKDPQFYAKKQALHAERVASYTKEIMDAEAARVAALPPPQTLQPSVTPAVPESQPKLIAAAPSVPKPVAAAVAKAVSDRNLTAWLAGLVAILLGWLGWRYFRKKARP